ncbi:MAG: UDP-glucose 4-epimerase, partial [Actinomycetota bacterium]|nr:UDP-glucose 4-epimerase [Actinomycetota bacterium]
LAGRPTVPVPLSAGGLLGQLVKRAGLADFSQDQMQYLAFGRGMDTTRMREVLRLEPEFTTRTAYEDFVSHTGPGLPGAMIAATVGGLAGSAAKLRNRLHASGRNN